MTHEEEREDSVMTKMAKKMGLIFIGLPVNVSPSPSKGIGPTLERQDFLCNYFAMR